MGKLLYIESSPRKKRSTSIEVANLFLQEYEKSHPSDDVNRIDLWNYEIPRFDGDIIDAKYAILHGQSHTEAQRKAWRAAEKLIGEFKEADKYVFSIPMWNFGIPYILKQYIDVLVQPTYTFSYSPEQGYKGLVIGKPAVLIYASGGSYAGGSEKMDFQKPYMETILKFIGFTDFHSINAAPTLSSPEEKQKVLEKAKEEAKKKAANF